MTLYGQINEGQINRTKLPIILIKRKFKKIFKCLLISINQIFLLYSFILSPIYVYPFEALEGLTMALMMTSAVTYVAKISTPTTIASVMGLMGAVFFGVGKGSGSLFGGLIMYNCGARVTFQILSAVAALSALIYGFFQFLYVRPLKLRA